MEFLRGVKINDVQGLKELGVNTQQVSLLSCCPSLMLFTQPGCVIVARDFLRTNIRSWVYPQRPASWKPPCAEAARWKAKDNCIRYHAVPFRVVYMKLITMHTRSWTVQRTHPTISVLTNNRMHCFPDTWHLRRKDYCNLWKAIVLRDKEKIEVYSRKMGAGDYHQLFAIVLTFRPMDKYVPLHSRYEG